MPIEIKIAKGIFLTIVKLSVWVAFAHILMLSISSLVNLLLRSSVDIPGNPLVIEDRKSVV